MGMQARAWKGENQPGGKANAHHLTTTRLRRATTLLMNWNEGARGRGGGHGSSQTAAKDSRQHTPPAHHLAEPEGDLGELLAGDLALAVGVEVAHCRFNSLPFAGRGSTCL